MQQPPPCEGSFVARDVEHRARPGAAHQRLGLWGYSTEAHQLRLDPAGAELLGEVAGEHAMPLEWLIERVAAEERARVAEWFARVLGGCQRGGLVCEVPLVGGDGRLQWLEWVVVPGWAFGGGLVGGTLRDLSGQRRAEGMMQAQQSLHEAVVRGEVLGDGVARLACMLEPWLGAGLGLLVWQVDSVAGQLEVVAGPWVAGEVVVGPVRLAPGGGVFASAAVFQEPAYADDLLREEGWSELGQWAVERGWQAAWAVPVAGGERVVGVLGVLLKQARLPDEWERQALMRIASVVGVALAGRGGRGLAGEWAQRCHEALAAHRKEKVYGFDGRQRLVYANPVNLHGWADGQQDLLGRRCGELGFEPWLAELYERNLGLVAQSGSAVEGEIPWRGADGWRTLEYLLVPVVEEDGRVGGVAGITRRVMAGPVDSGDGGFLVELSGRLSGVASEAEVLAVAGELVAARLGVPRCYLIELPAGGGRVVHTCWAADGSGGAGLGELCDELAGCLADGTLLIEDVASDPRTCEMGEWLGGFGIAACAARAFLWEGRHAAMLVVTAAAPREWTREEIRALDEAVARVWPVVERLRAEEVLRRQSAQLRQSEERQAFLLRLVDALRPLDDPAAIHATAAGMLAGQLGVRRVRLRECVGSGLCCELAEMVDDCLAGRTVVVSDVRGHAGYCPATLAAFEAQGVRAHVTVPLLKHGELVAELSVQHDAPREWSIHEVAMIEACVDRAWTAMERARAQRSLRQSEERFRSFAEHADEILWIVDLEQRRMEYLSPAFERVYGLDRGPIMADLSNWMRFIHPHDHDRAADLMSAIQRGERFSWEFRILRPDGAVCWLESIAFPMPGEDGAVRRLGGKSQDITERKRAEQTAQRSARANGFRLALADALAALGAADELCTAAVGLLEEHFAAQAVRWAEPQTAGASGWPELVAGGGGQRRGKRLVIEDVASAGMLGADERAELEARGVGAMVEVSLWKGGRQVARLVVEHREARCWDEEELVLVEEAAERLWAALEQARAEHKLRDSEQRLRLVSEHIPALIAYVEPDLRYKFTNREYSVWLGTPGEDFGGRLVRDILGEKTFAHRLPLLQRAMAGEMVRVEAILNHQVLGERTIDLSLVPDFADGRVRGCYVMAVDVTERLQLVATLREADQRKNEFLATLAHELRNPLAPIRTGVEVLKHSLGNPQRVTQVLDVIERQTSQMVRLVDDLLDIARISRGTLKLRQEVVAVAEVFADAVEVVRPQLDRAGHRLEVSLPVVPLYAKADAGRLAQVIANLLNNAVRYTPEGGNIRLSAEERGEHIWIVVRDNGDGIDPSMQASIFEMFTQLGREGRPNSEGLGIGLTLVRLLVGLHGGRVEVFSEGLGKGSEFRVELPRAAAPDELGVGGCAGGEKGEGERSACKVLVVDDARSTADMMALFLKLEGYEARVAYSGSEALEAAEQMCPRIIFMDIGMPHMDGFEAAQRIRQLDCCRDTVLIALTGWSQESDRQRTRAAGFDHHLVKPVEPKMLRALLDELGGGRMES